MRELILEDACLTSKVFGALATLNSINGSERRRVPCASLQLRPVLKTRSAQSVSG